jgi:hypothetical protein
MTEETTNIVQSSETKCFRKMLGISWRDKTNNFVCSQITSLADPQEPLLTTVKRKQLMVWTRHAPQLNAQNSPPGRTGRQ